MIGAATVLLPVIVPAGPVPVMGGRGRPGESMNSFGM
jgi:hypothetical protein